MSDWPHPGTASLLPGTPSQCGAPPPQCLQDRLVAFQGGFQHYKEQGGEGAAVQQTVRKPCLTRNLAAGKAFEGLVKEGVRALPTGDRTAKTVTAVMEDMAANMDKIWLIADSAPR